MTRYKTNINNEGGRGGNLVQLLL